MQKIEMITDDVRNYFTKGSTYLVKKDAKTGFQRDNDIPAGTKITFSDFQYSHYDGCFSCHFKNEEKNEEIYFWIQEDTKKEELDKTFELLK